MDKAAEAKHQIPVRLPTSLHQKLDKLAKSQRRSMNGQIVLAVEEHIARESGKP